MATLEELVVKISVEMGDLKAEMARLQKEIEGVGNETEKAEKKSSSHLKKLIPSWKEVGLAVTAAVTALTGAGLKMVQMAADADATTAKFATIFSGMEDATQAWVDQFVADTGRHKYATMDALSDIQAVSTAMGVEKEAGVEMAKALLERSTDIAAFFNANDPEVLEAVKSGLVGEMEPLKKYGVILSEANVQQELSNMLGAEGAKTATAAQKVQARTNIILAQTSAIQGQQAREAGSLQEQWKRLSNTLSTTFADAGRDAMQSMTGVITRINELLGSGGISAISSVLKSVADAVAWVAERVLDAVGAFRQWGSSGAFDAIRNFAQVVLANLRSQLASSIQAVRDFAGNGGFGRLAEAATNVINGLARLNQFLGDVGAYRALGTIIGNTVRGFLQLIDTISRVINFLADLYRSFRTTYDQISSGTTALRSTLSAAWNTIVSTITGAANSVYNAVVNAWNNIRNAIANAMNSITSGIGTGWRGILAVVVSVLASIFSTITGRFSSIQSAVQGAMNSIRNIFSSVFGGMSSIASSAMSGVVRAISSSGSSMASAAAGAGQQAVNALQAKLSQAQLIASQIRTAVDRYNQYQSLLQSSGSSSGGSSSGSSSSTGIKRQGKDGTGEENVKIREIHDTGGMASYTGWHWMKKGEVAIPPQYDWQSNVVNPVVNALGGKAGAGTVTVNINNKAADINTTAKTVAKVTKASVRAVMV